MAKAFVWSTQTAREIAALPSWGSSSLHMLIATVEAGEQQLAPEIVAYLVREAYAHGERAWAERLFAILWRQYAALVSYFARGYERLLQGALTVDDVIASVFTQLFRRLQAAEDVTFYECHFMLGLKRLTWDVTARLPDDPVDVLPPTDRDTEDDTTHDPPDPTSIDPAQYVEAWEQSEDFTATLRALLRNHPKNVQATALYLLQGKSQEEIARLVGVSSRMVRNYKQQLEKILEPRARV